MDKYDTQVSEDQIESPFIDDLGEERDRHLEAWKPMHSDIGKKERGYIL